MAARLVVVRDGITLDDEEARVLWKKMSAHLDVERGDFAGFARSVGCATAKVETRGAQAVLTLATKGFAGARPAKPATPPKARAGKARKR